MTPTTLTFQLGDPWSGGQCSRRSCSPRPSLAIALDEFADAGAAE